VIALPGGVGTLDEVFHVMAAPSPGLFREKEKYLFFFSTQCCHYSGIVKANDFVFD